MQHSAAAGTHPFFSAKASADLYTLGQAKVVGRTGGVGLSTEKGRSCERTRLFQSIDAASPKLDSTLFQSLARPVHSRITPHSWTCSTADMIQVLEETEFFLSSRLLLELLLVVRSCDKLKGVRTWRLVQTLEYSRLRLSYDYRKFSNFERWCCTRASFSSMLQIWQSRCFGFFSPEALMARQR